MMCGRCKTVATIRITFPANRCVDSRGRYLSQSVERCPKCHLEWCDVPEDYVVALPRGFRTNLEKYQAVYSNYFPIVVPEIEQITLF